MSEMEPPTHEDSPPIKPPAASRRGRPPGSRKEDWIASQLRRVYDGAAEEEVPASMLDLLKALDDSEEGGHG